MFGFGSNEALVFPEPGDLFVVNNTIPYWFCHWHNDYTIQKATLLKEVHSTCSLSANNYLFVIDSKPAGTLVRLSMVAAGLDKKEQKLRGKYDLVLGLALQEKTNELAKILITFPKGDLGHFLQRVET